MATWKQVNPEHGQRQRKSAHSFASNDAADLEVQRPLLVRDHSCRHRVYTYMTIPVVCIMCLLSGNKLNACTKLNTCTNRTTNVLCSGRFSNKPPTVLKINRYEHMCCRLHTTLRANPLGNRKHKLSTGRWSHRIESSYSYRLNDQTTQIISDRLKSKNKIQTKA